MHGRLGRFADKTKNAWGDRATFQHVHGKYDLLQVEEEEESTENEVVGVVVDDGGAGKKSRKGKSRGRSTRAGGDAEVDVEQAVVESQLPLPIQDVMGLIFDRKEMEATLSNFKFDVAKAPLGV